MSVCRGEIGGDLSPSSLSGLGLEEEVPDYDLDSEDEEWLNAQTKERVSGPPSLLLSLPLFLSSLHLFSHCPVCLIS